jgi:hypothetical protein
MQNPTCLPDLAADGRSMRAGVCDPRILVKDPHGGVRGDPVHRPPADLWSGHA